MGSPPKVWLLPRLRQTWGQACRAATDPHLADEDTGSQRSRVTEGHRQGAGGDPRVRVHRSPGPAEPGDTTLGQCLGLRPLAGDPPGEPKPAWYGAWGLIRSPGRLCLAGQARGCQGGPACTPSGEGVRVGDSADRGRRTKARSRGFTHNAGALGLHPIPARRPALSGFAVQDLAAPQHKRMGIAGLAVPLLSPP